jgi:thymidylate kinase
VLVTFEGLDGGGKSSLMREVAAGLRSTLREHVLHLADISRSPTGRRLAEVFRADELFGQETVGSTVMSRCLAAAADLFYFDGALIAPMVAAGGVVLKERHVDTLISHEGPVLTRRYGWSEERAYEWLSSVVEPLQVRPKLTIMVEAPRSHRERRLRERLKSAGAELGRTEADVDRAVFRIRAEWYERLRLKDGNRWVSIANPDGELRRATARAISEILERHAREHHSENLGSDGGTYDRRGRRRETDEIPAGLG